MPAIALVDRDPVVDADELVDGLVPPPRFDAVRFSTYRPASDEPSQQAAVTALSAFGESIGKPPRRGLFRRSAPAAAGGYYLDGGFGVGKTHLLASLWHSVPGPKAYGTFVEYTHLVGALGYARTVRRLSGHKLLAVDEFELDDPGDTMLMTRLLGQLCDAGVSLAATSNTLPDKLGEGLPPRDPRPVRAFPDAADRRAGLPAPRTGAGAAAVERRGGGRGSRFTRCQPGFVPGADGQAGEPAPIAVRAAGGRGDIGSVDRRAAAGPSVGGVALGGADRPPL
jgi:hypothetical protein